MQIIKPIFPFVRLMRFDKPIGILLLLWPTLWALWLAGESRPDNFLIFIFIVGVIVMRAAGCIINDIADRKVDGYVERTAMRPLASGEISTSSALALFAVLMLLAFGLVLMCNKLTIQLAFIGAALASVYPFLKRVTHLPQCGLGLAFSWGVPMAFAAQKGYVPWQAWLLFVTASLWPIIYDTFYAMVDRRDDMKVGIKSTAILFGAYDRSVIALLQITFLVLLVLVQLVFHLNFIFLFAIIIVGLLFAYQQYLIRSRDPAQCFNAFLNNHWVGLTIFVGILIGIK